MNKRVEITDEGVTNLDLEELKQYEKQIGKSLAVGATVLAAGFLALVFVVVVILWL